MISKEHFLIMSTLYELVEKPNNESEDLQTNVES